MLYSEGREPTTEASTCVGHADRSCPGGLFHARESVLAKHRAGAARIRSQLRHGLNRHQLTQQIALAGGIRWFH
jgi:hypothetical protein